MGKAFADCARIACILVSCGLLSVSTGRVMAGGFLNPSNYASNQSLLGFYDPSAPPVDIAINTSGSLPTMTMPDGTVINGVITADGTTAVFSFTSINLTNATIIAEGALPVAILTTGNANLSSVTVDVGSYSSPSTFVGNYLTPTTGIGAGGSAAGLGPGSGLTGWLGLSGGGGGYGGAGGAGGQSTGSSWVFTQPGSPPTQVTTTYSGGPGGSTYGGSGLPLQGGSGGGNAQYMAQGSEGAGGGAVQIGAAGSMTMQNDQVIANGANGQDQGIGGGSGGEIAITGSTVDITNTVLSANGGLGGPSESWGGEGAGSAGYGGDGGGGRIEVDGFSVNFNGSANVDGANAGSFIIDPFPPIVPEPSSLLLLATAAVLGLGYKCRRSTHRASDRLAS